MVKGDAVLKNTLTCYLQPRIPVLVPVPFVAPGAHAEIDALPGAVAYVSTKFIRHQFIIAKIIRYLVLGCIKTKFVERSPMLSMFQALHKYLDTLALPHVFSSQCLLMFLMDLSEKPQNAAD